MALYKRFLALTLALGLAVCDASTTTGDAATQRDTGSGLDASTTTDAALLDAAAPDTATPDTTIPDTPTPDMATPDTATSDTAAPDTAVPDTAVPDMAVPDMAMPDTMTSDTATSDTATPDTATSDTATPDTATSDTAMPDTATSDTATSDIATTDAAVVDSASSGGSITCPPLVNADSVDCPSYLGDNVVSLCTCSTQEQAALSCNPGAHFDRTYCWSAPGNGTFRFDLSQRATSLALGLFSADDGCQELGCSALGQGSVIDLAMTSGQRVYIVLDEIAGNSSFTLAVHQL